MATSTTLELFSSFQEFIQEEQTTKEYIRDIVRDLEQKARGMLAIVQGVHQKANKENVDLICKSVRDKFPSLMENLQKLKEKIPVGEYYRYHDHWRFVLQRLVFLLAFITYLEKEELVSREETASALCIELNWKDGFHLDLDDYLMGILQLASELSRLCMNVVIAGDYETPRKISIFMNELDAAFRLLNLKNDMLRKRFDGLKYDLKKVEEVVYDLSIRGLKTQTQA